MTRKQIEKAAEEAGWNVTIGKRDDGGYDIDFQMYTDFGQDRNEPFYVQKLEDIKSEVYDRYQNFDPSEEAMLWVGEDGHGKNGAPDDIRDIIADMEDVESKLEDLYTVLNGGTLLNERHDKYYRKAIELRNECQSELLSNYHRAQPSKFGYDAKGFANPDRCSKYEEIIYLYGTWTLIDGNSNQYPVEVMPLEELCKLVDDILKEKE